MTIPVLQFGPENDDKIAGYQETLGCREWQKWYYAFLSLEELQVSDWQLMSELIQQKQMMFLSRSQWQPRWENSKGNSSGAMSSFFGG